MIAFLPFIEHQIVSLLDQEKHVFELNHAVNPHIIEPFADGHRMQYVRRIVDALPLNKIVYLSTFPGSCEHPAFKQVKALAGARLVVHLITDEDGFKASIKGKDGLRLQPAFWKLFREHWRSLSADQKGDRVLVPYLDYCSYAIGLRGSPFGKTPFQGVVMRPDFHWQEMGVIAPVSKLARVKRWLFLRLLKNRYLQELVTIDPSLKDWSDGRQPKSFQKLRYMEDPSDMQGEGGREEALVHFGIPPEKKVILLFGAIDGRKGLRSLLKALNDEPFQDCVALIAGKQTMDARAILSNSSLAAHRLHCVDRYVDAQEEWLAFQAADWVWLAYEDFYGPSGVLAQANQMGKSIIHNGKGLIGYVITREFGGNGLVLCKKTNIDLFVTK